MPYSVPLVVEVWDREKDKAQSNILGVVQLVLLNVLQEQRARAVVSCDAFYLPSILIPAYNEYFDS